MVLQASRMGSPPLAMRERSVTRGHLRRRRICVESTPHGLHCADPRAGAVAAGAGRDRILLGRIAGAHGIRGEVIIHAFTEPPENIAAYGPLIGRGGRAHVRDRERARDGQGRGGAAGGRRRPHRGGGAQGRRPLRRARSAAGGSRGRILPRRSDRAGGRRSATASASARSSPCRTTAPAICWRSASPARGRPSSSRSPMRTCRRWTSRRGGWWWCSRPPTRADAE